MNAMCQLCEYMQYAGNLYAAGGVRTHCGTIQL